MKSLAVLKSDIAKLMESDYSLRVTAAAVLISSYINGNICNLVRQSNLGSISLIV